MSYQGDYVEGFKTALQKRAQEVLEKKQKHDKNVSELLYVVCKMAGCIFYTFSIVRKCEVTRKMALYAAYSIVHAH